MVGFNGPDYTPQCGPAYAIDNAQGTGWGSTTGDDAGTPTNKMIDKHVDIKLPAKVNISAFNVDPSNTCGDPGSSSTGAYDISTSTVGPNGPWTSAASGTFVTADRGHLNEVPPPRPPVTPGCSGFGSRSTATRCPTSRNACLADPTAFGGCTFTDLSEFAVFGSPAS